MKKIGILTYFWAHNPGTFLQAYSTLNVVRQNFPDYKVEIINCKIRKVRFRPSKYDLNFHRLFERYRNHVIYEKLIDKYLPKSPRGIISFNYHALKDYILQQNYDLILVGADTVLEILPQHFDLGEIPIYWLPPEIKCKKILFSASAGAITTALLNSHYREALSKSIDSFDFLGVRDDNTYNLIMELGFPAHTKLKIIPDPTFTMNIDHSAAEKFLSMKQIKFEKPTIAINLPESLPVCQKLIDYYLKKGFSVVLLGYGGYAPKKSECRFPMMSPFEWAGIHRNFSLEITDRFHGCIFSLKNSIPVVAVDHERRKLTPSGLSKKYSLLKLYNLHNTNHISLMNMKNYEEVIKITDRALENFDYEYVKQRTKELCEDYINNLKEVLGDLL